MYGFLGGVRLGHEWQGQAAKAIVGTVTTLLTEASALKAARHCALTPTNRPRMRKSGPRTIDELVAARSLRQAGRMWIFRWREIGPERQGQAAKRPLLERLQLSSLKHRLSKRPKHCALTPQSNRPRMRGKRAENNLDELVAHYRPQRAGRRESKDGRRSRLGPLTSAI